MPEEVDRIEDDDEEEHDEDDEDDGISSEDHENDVDCAIADHFDEGGDTPPSTPPPPLTVIVPGRVGTLVQDQATIIGPTAWTLSSAPSPSQLQAERGCGCVTVLDGTGALEFNTEDVAALLTLALARVRPFMPLAARITVAAEEAAWDGGGADGGNRLEPGVWAALLEYVFECRASATAAVAVAVAVAASPAVGSASSIDLFSAVPLVAGTFPTAHKLGGCFNGSVATFPPAAPGLAHGLQSDEEEAMAMALSSDGAAAGAGLEGEDMSGLTVDEAADMLEYVAAARFIAQVMSEPVVAAGVSAGRWAYTERLAEQVRKLAEAEEENAATVTAICAAPAANFDTAAGVPSKSPSLSNMLCLGALADVQSLGVAMARQARYAPALEATLRAELRRALRRGQGGSRQRRIKNRLQQQQAAAAAVMAMSTMPRGAAPDVFSFPMITPCCCFEPAGGGL